MVNWQITARTLYCDCVADEVTLLINSDGSFDCTGFQRYGTDTVDSSRARREHSKITSQTIACTGKSCKILNDYAADVLSGEKS